MLVATLVAAAVLGQACPQPSSRNGPPPCAAANVPGCLPGYHREVDAWGRARYVCDAVAAPQPQPAPEAGPPEGAPPPPPRYVPAPPRAVPAYPGAWTPPPERRGHVGLVLMPGVSSARYYARENTTAGAVALEVRPDHGGARLRASFDGSRYMRAVEVGLKYDFFDWAQVRPFLALGVGAGGVDPDPTWRLTGSLAAGVDLYLTRNAFFTVELKGRAFAERPESAAYGLETGTLHQTQFFMGVGFYF